MIRALYLANAALLTAHEIDAAYFREWDLFRLPGGRDAFLALHVPLVVAVVWGYGRVVAGARAGAWASIALACAGLVALLVHGLLLWQGGAEFRTPASLGLLAAVGSASVAQLAAVLRARGSAPGVPAPSRP